VHAAADVTPRTPFSRSYPRTWWKRRTAKGSAQDRQDKTQDNTGQHRTSTTQRPPVWRAHLSCAKNGWPTKSCGPDRRVQATTHGQSLWRNSVSDILARLHTRVNVLWPRWSMLCCLTREGHTLACVYMSIVDQRGRLPGRWTCWLLILLAFALATYCEERDHSVGYRLHTPRRIQMIMWS
jgi:hypothetical protein